MQSALPRSLRLCRASVTVHVRQRRASLPLRHCGVVLQNALALPWSGAGASSRPFGLRHGALRALSTNASDDDAPAAPAADKRKKAEGEDGGGGADGKGGAKKVKKAAASVSVPKVEIRGLGDLLRVRIGEMVMNIPGLLFRGVRAAASWSVSILLNPFKLVTQSRELWEHIKHEAQHYWVGSKLLWRDVLVAQGILGRMLGGHRLSRRERRQLLRTTTDIFRLVPLSIFVIVPFMEFLLPFALRLFPNLLPSTFQDDLKREEQMKRELKGRLALAGFMADALQDMARRRKRKELSGEEEAGAEEALKFLDKAKFGAHFDTEEIIRMSRLFKDELTLDSLPRHQLVLLCQYMNASPYGTDAFLRWQLRTKLNYIREDDAKILWEGVESLTKEELREACRERGMRSHGLLRQGYERNLRQWLELSMHRSVPISLLIMSRAFALENADHSPETLIGETIGSLDEAVVNEVVLDAASLSEEQTKDMKERKLKALAQQAELIKKEREEEELKEAISTQDPDVARAIAGEDARAKPAAAIADAASGAAAAEPLVQEVEVVSKGLFFDAEEPAEPEAPPEEEEEDKPKVELTVEDVEALETLTAKSAVSQEKEELESLRAGLQELEDTEEAWEAPAEPDQDAAPAPEAEAAEEPQPQEEPRPAEEQIQESPSEELPSQEVPPPDAAEAQAAEAEGSSGEAEAEEEEEKEVAAEEAEAEEEEEEEEEEEAPDLVISAMRSKVDAMLGRLEGQMERVESDIGEKLHLLDKDDDGILTTAELKDVVQHVLRKHDTEEAAEEIVAALDEDGDGQITVLELKEWIDKRGRDLRK